MARLSPQLIQAARTGDDSKLSELATKITTANYTLEALSAGLIHLKLDDIPEEGSPPPRGYRLNLSISAIFCLLCAVMNCSRTSELEVGTSRLLENEIEGVIAWLSLMLKEATGSHQLAVNTFMALSRLSPDLLRLMCSSRRTLNLVMEIWYHQVPIEVEVDGLENHNWKTPSAVVMNTYLSNPGGIKVFHDLVVPSENHLAMFYQSLSQKLQQLSQIFPTSSTNTQALLETVKIFSDIHHRVHCLSSSRSRERSKCLKELANTFNILQVAEDGQDLVHFIHSGLLSTLVSDFPLCGWEDDEARGTYIISSLAAYACYPRYLRALLRGLSVIPRILLSSGVDESSPNLWRSLFYTISMRAPFLQEASPESLPCENHWAHESNIPRVDATSIKVCSGCRLMAYCSVTCQNEDWQRRHRAECDELWEAVNKWEHDGRRFSQSARAFQLALATRFFNSLSFQRILSSYQATSYPNHKANDLLVSIDTTDGSMFKNSMIIRSWEEYILDITDNGVAWAPRATAFMQDARAKEHMDIMTMEAIFRWDERMNLCMLIEFTKNAGGMFIPLRHALGDTPRRKCREDLKETVGSFTWFL
ncbi:hypothetical protein BKA70DRAFT_1540015 [Coprinopsis sp. MPI-PUGE-AT-0042]|nr:hypothetical protein BKA70DRAFT_1540015 [Coprinopsis sp. MPI-PUGE-AT-0042]